MRTLILSLCLWSALCAAGDFPIVVDPVVNATPPGVKVTAGYFTLVNETDKDITITGAYSPTIAKVEIHESVIEDDVAKMEKQDSLIVKSGASLEFSHGAYHLMLMELTEPLNAGQSVDIILATSIGDMMIEMPVVKMGTMQHTDQQSGASDKKAPEHNNHANSEAEHNHDSDMDEAEKISSK